MNTTRSRWMNNMALARMMRIAGVALCLVATPALAPTAHAAGRATHLHAQSDACAVSASNVAGWFLDGDDPAEYTYSRVRGAAADGAGAVYLEPQRAQLQQHHAHLVGAAVVPAPAGGVGGLLV